MLLKALITSRLPLYHRDGVIIVMRCLFYHAIRASRAVTGHRKLHRELLIGVFVQANAVLAGTKRTL